MAVKYPMDIQYYGNIIAMKLPVKWCIQGEVFDKNGSRLCLRNKHAYPQQLKNTLLSVGSRVDINIRNIYQEFD